MVEALEARNLLAALTVTNILDDGSAGSLRAVLGSAQNGDVVRFDQGLAGQTITLKSELDLTTNVTVRGLGSDRLTVSGGGNGRVFHVAPGAADTITGLTVTGGRADKGGGVLNEGTLTLQDVTLTGNTATAAGGALTAAGGAVYNAGTMEVKGCTLSYNAAQAGPGLSFNSKTAAGGAVYNAGTMEVEGSTLSHNAAQWGPGRIDLSIPTQFRAAGVYDSPVQLWTPGLISLENIDPIPKAVDQENPANGLEVQLLFFDGTNWDGGSGLSWIGGGPTTDRCAKVVKFS